jgi:lysophospholipid acyltransferase (LPLAT)-like uncharacterized protein
LSSSPLPANDRFLAWGASWLGWLLLQLVGKTSRFCTHRSPGYLHLLASGRPYIYAFWHRFQLLLVYEHRHRGVMVLISQSRDGELIAQAVRRFGFRTARGSSSRGGAAALGRVIDRLREGGVVAFTPDGPRGPLRSGVPIVPVAWAASRVKELSSWDRFLVPLPFSRNEVVFGDPLSLSSEDPSPEEKVRNALDAAAREAERLLSEQPHAG